MLVQKFRSVFPRVSTSMMSLATVEVEGDIPLQTLVSKFKTWAISTENLMCHLQETFVSLNIQSHVKFVDFAL